MENFRQFPKVKQKLIPSILIKNENVFLSRILPETTEKAGFIYSSGKLAKTWSILPRTMISLTSLTKIL